MRCMPMMLTNFFSSSDKSSSSQDPEKPMITLFLLNWKNSSGLSIMKASHSSIMMMSSGVLSKLRSVWYCAYFGGLSVAQRALNSF